MIRILYTYHTRVKMEFNIFNDKFKAYDLKGYIYKDLEINENNQIFLIPCDNDCYQIFDFNNQEFLNINLKNLNIPNFVVPLYVSKSDKYDLVLNSIFKEVQSIFIYEARITFNEKSRSSVYSLSQEELENKINEIKIELLKSYRKDLILNGSFHSKLLAIETIHEELKLASDNREENLENLALESFVDSFIKGFDEDAGLQMISSGRSSSLLNRHDKEELSKMQRKYYDLIDSDPDITLEKLKEFSASLFYIHREGIKHYKILKRS